MLVGGHIYLYSQSLTVLRLAFNEIGNEGVQHLAEVLKINRVRKDSLTFIILLFYILYSQTLTELDLMFIDIEDESAQYLGDALKINQVREYLLKYSIDCFFFSIHRR